MKNAQDKMHYFNMILGPKISKAFVRGDSKYKGIQHNMSDYHMARLLDDDIRHVTDCHAVVRLREAEDLMGMGKRGEALSKIESAIGYLVILHARVNKYRINRGD